MKPIRATTSAARIPTPTEIAKSATLRHRPTIRPRRKATGRDKKTFEGNAGSAGQPPVRPRWTTRSHRCENNGASFTILRSSHDDNVKLGLPVWRFRLWTTDTAWWENQVPNRRAGVVDSAPSLANAGSQLGRASDWKKRRLLTSLPVLLDGFELVDAERPQRRLLVEPQPSRTDMEFKPPLVRPTRPGQPFSTARSGPARADRCPARLLVTPCPGGLKRLQSDFKRLKLAWSFGRS